jgi:hypothetical protein
MFKTPRTACVALAAMTLFFCACDSDNPVTGEDGHHLEALGTAIIQGSDTLVMATSADPNDVSGVIELYENESLENLQVIFLDDHGDWFLPDPQEHEDHSLNLLHNQLALHIDVDPATWLVDIQGLTSGETVLRVEIEHEDHADYVSPELPIHVEEQAGTHGPPVGMNLVYENVVLATAHPNRDVTGGTFLQQSESIGPVEIWFFDEDSTLFQPGVDHYPEFTLEDSEWVQLLDYEQAGYENVWSFSVMGLAIGSGGLVIDILHGDHSHYTSPSIPFSVE